MNILQKNLSKFNYIKHNVKNYYYSHLAPKYSKNNSPSKIWGLFLSGLTVMHGYKYLNNKMFCQEETKNNISSTEDVSREEKVSGLRKMYPVKIVLLF